MKNKKIVTVTLILSILAGLLFSGCSLVNSKINRKALVTRHNSVLSEVNVKSPFSVGNGHFAFTADVTGLQTFPDYYYDNGMALDVLSDWGWHVFDNPHGYTMRDASEQVEVQGRKIWYPTKQSSKAGHWLRSNPHRIPLGILGFEITLSDGSSLNVSDIQSVDQKLDMWKGVIHSKFTVEDVPVEVITVCHPEKDIVGVRVVSPLIQKEQIKISCKFPYTHDHRIKNNPPLDWSKPECHESQILSQTETRLSIQRNLKKTETTYYVDFNWNAGKAAQQENHVFTITPDKACETFEFSVQFSSETIEENAPDLNSVLQTSVEQWETFWKSGGAIDLSGSTDPRASELERRIVLSQYLTRIQSAGYMPPQESGLTNMSWHGKFHTEMVWWNTAHFLHWGRPELLESSFQWFIQNLEYAKSTAKFQGFDGARWSKMVGPDGRESPGNNPFILWNQPHPINMAEMIYKLKPTEETIGKYMAVVMQTADFMSDFLERDDERKQYNLGPPVWPVQEIYNPREASNPAFELAYWKYGLEIAQQWRERLGVGRSEVWDWKIDHLAPLPVKDSLYVAIESSPNTFTDIEMRNDHPSLLMTKGFLPGEDVDTEMMRRTLKKVMEMWDWETKIWGWDYPMIAMTAVRVGEPELALDILFADAPGNTYLPNGHCPVRRDLMCYLPANGGLLAVTAMMAAGWENGPEDAPGFPKDGTWKVKWEGLERLP